MSHAIQSWRNFRLRLSLQRAMERYASSLFAPAGKQAVLETLARCSFPLVEPRTVESLRIKIAILILSKGDWGSFQLMVKAAQRDWRDVLYAAGMAFANWKEVIRLKGVLID